MEDCLFDAAAEASAAEYVWLLAGLEVAIARTTDASERRFLAAVFARLRAAAWVGIEDGVAAR